MIDLSGRVVIVTGASSGLGAHTARYLARCGAQVVAVGRDAERLNSANLGDPQQIHRVVADVSHPECGALIAESALAACGRIDALVNNAGMEIPGGIESLSDEALLAMFDTNVFGLVRCTRAALPSLEQVGGSIVNLGSTVVNRPPPGRYGYIASKGAVESMSRSWAADLGPRGIRVNVVRPGRIPSGLRGSTEAEESASFGAPEMARQALRTIGSGADVAHAVSFLVSDLARWITGAVIDVDGGYTLGIGG